MTLLNGIGSPSMKELRALGLALEKRLTGLLDEWLDDPAASAEAASDTVAVPEKVELSEADLLEANPLQQLAFARQRFLRRTERSRIELLLSFGGELVVCQQNPSHYDVHYQGHDLRQAMATVATLRGQLEAGGFRSEDTLASLSALVAAIATVARDRRDAWHLVSF